MPKITFGPNEIKNGWGTDFTASNSVGLELPQGKYSKSQYVSLYRLGRMGQIAPGETFTSLTDSGSNVTGLPINGTVDSAGEAYVILDNARVVQFGTSDEVIDTNNSTAHGGHSSLSGEDIISYKTGSTEYVLYSFNDATDADVGRKTVGGAYDDDYLSTVPTNVTSGGSPTILTTGVPHQMKIGPDGNVYITNGQYIARLNISTANGTIDYTALNLGDGFVATGLEIESGYLVIIGYKAFTTGFIGTSRSEARVWFWDTTSTFYQNVYDIKDNYASAIFNGENGLYAFTSGRNNTTKIKVFNGNRFVTIFESHTTTIGNAPRQGSVCDFQNMVHYAPKSNPNIHVIDGKAFHNRTVGIDSSESQPSDIGMVKNLYQNYLLIGRKVSTTYTIAKIDQSGYVPDSYLRLPITALPGNSTIKKIVLYFSQFGSGASLGVSLFKNYASISIGGADDLTNKTVTNATYGAVSRIPIEVTAAINVDVFLLMLSFTHANTTDVAAILRKVEVYYESPERF